MKALSLGHLRARIQNAHPRTRKAQLNTVLGLAVKGGGVLLSLLLVPMTIDYLSKEAYGTWLTISSIVTMLVFFDIGIGNGLRNKFSEAVSKQDQVLARAYVSTAYFIFGILQASFILIFLLIFRYLPWQQVLNTTVDNEQLQLVVLITAVAIAVKLVLDIMSYVLFALQESGLVNLMNLLANLLILGGTYALTRFSSGNMIYLACVTALSPVLIMLISGFVLYRDRLKLYRPSLQFADRKYAKSLLSLGYKFFVIQMAVVVLFYTDNLIVAQLFGPAEVTIYSITYRYFNVISTVFSIVLIPYWSAFTEASIKNDTEWMERTYGYLQKLWVGLVAVIVLMVIVAGPVYSLWIGDRINVPTPLNVVMGVSALIICWNNITVSVINGLGKVKLQLLCSVFAALSNIPLAIFLSRGLELGSAGVMIATCLSLLPASITGTIQARKLIQGTAHGIWAK